MIRSSIKWLHVTTCRLDPAPFAKVFSAKLEIYQKRESFVPRKFPAIRIIHRRLNYLCISIGIHFLPILGMILSDMYFSCKGKKHDEMPSLSLKGSVYAASLCKSSHVCMSVHLVSLIVNTLSCKYRIVANFQGY